MRIVELNAIMDFWIDALDQYSLAQLHVKPEENHFSLGQLYNHLIADTGFYLEQMKVALSDNRHEDEVMTPMAKEMFDNNSFPNERLKGDPSNDMLPQPESIIALSSQLNALKIEFNDVAKKTSEANRGKSMHPGFGFFNAHEWVQFAEMHFRHHLRQKNRLDDFLLKG